jgi:hypothetical protein
MPKKRRPYYSREHVEMLRDIVSLETVVHMTNTALSYAGPHRLKGLCPFHGEKHRLSLCYKTRTGITASVVVYREISLGS